MGILDGKVAIVSGAGHGIGRGHALELAKHGAEVVVIEADEVPDDEFKPLDPSTSSPLVAWLASDESQHVTGQVIRAVGDKIVLMQGWSEGASITTTVRWDATKLGMQLATDVFKTRAPGLRF